MRIIYSLSSVCMLILLITFFFYNVISLSIGGVGYGFLFLSVMLSGIIIILKAITSDAIYIRFSFLLLLLFFSYFLLKIIADIGDINALKQFSVGTSGGILFAYSLGVFTVFSVQALIKCPERSKWGLQLTTLCILLIVTFYFVLLTKTILFHLTDLRTDIFLINSVGAYQRPCDLIAMSFIVLSCLTLSVTFINKTKMTKNKNIAVLFNKFVIVLIIMIYLLSAPLLMFLSQMIGSNKNVLFIGISTLITISFILITVINQHKLDTYSNYLTAVYSRKLNYVIQLKPLIKMIFISGLIFTVLISAVIYIFNFDIDSLRIMNYGRSDKSKSLINSRIYILLNYFPIHLDHSPIFGQMNVEELTTGKGTYVHSFLLSIITHLGLICFMFFCIFLLMTFRAILKTKNDFYLMTQYYYLQKSFQFYRIFMILAVLAIGTVSSFITWMPFWFALGFFATPVVFFRKNRTYLEPIMRYQERTR